MPDLFVPVDTSFYSTYYRDILAKGILHRFCNNYIDENRKMLKKEYPTEKSFVERFNVTEPMMQGLIDLAQKEGVTPDSAMIATSSPALRVYVKALIGRDLFEQSTYYLIANKLNPIYNQAVRLISDPAEYRKRISPDAR